VGEVDGPERVSWALLGAWSRAFQVRWS